jgi:uncharacterized protein
MAPNVVHFAIHADNVERARGFYEAVFGWRFEAWGPPGFFVIHTGTADDPGIAGALHARTDESDAPPLGMRGFECTVSVDDLGTVKERVLQHGGTIVYDEVEIPTVGTLVQFLDTEGNVANAMRYEPQHLEDMRAGR